MTTAKTGTVYALVDPRNNRVRYIGATTQALAVRLKGHLVTKVRRVKVWVDELAAQGLAPRIEPIVDGIPRAELRDQERAEIARRLIAGEPLLNEAATASARRHVEKHRQLEQAERERAAWEFAANKVRSVVGGPLPPGEVPPIRVSRELEEAYRVLQVAAAELERQSDPDLTEHARLCSASTKVERALWSAVQPMWGHLRGMSRHQFDDALGLLVGTVFGSRWQDLRDAGHYLALLPWGMLAVGPWIALAERAGMESSGTKFITWATDDAAVREALEILMVDSGRRMGLLSALDSLETDSRPSTGLLTMTAAHHPGFDIPEELHPEVRLFLTSMVQYGQLTPAMADLLLGLNPGALDDLLGPDIASEIDAQLGLPPGTSLNVLTSLLEGRRRPHLGNLKRIVSRAAGAFPTVKTPDYATWTGDTVPIFQAITATLVAAGLLEAPARTSAAEFVSEVQALWTIDSRRLKRAA